MRLEIARAGVNAAVEPVGVDAQGRMGTPADARDVGWYEPGSRPGEPGDAVIDGHLEWYSGPAVFANLHAVRAGDAVIVATATSRLAFVVDRVDTYPYDAVVPGLFAASGPPQLSLITCTGVWDPAAHIYLGRLVVHATLAPDMTHL